jgi:hypothetical protein
MSKEKLREVFGRPTFDSAFKFVMGDESVLLEFIKIFAKLDDVKKVEIQDVSLSPGKGLTSTRTVLNDTGLKRLLAKISNSSSISISCQRSESETVTFDGKDLKNLSNVFEDIRGAFPQPERD